MTTNPPTDRSPSLAELEIRSELFDAMDGNLRMSKRHKLLDAYRDAVLAVPAAVSVPPPTRAADRAALRDRIADTVTPFLMNFSDEETAKINAGEVAAAVLAVLPEAAGRAATSVCICGHPKQQHFEDVCITEITGCNCGDYLEPEATREVIDRWRQAAIQARAEGLTDAADFVRGLLLTRTGITTAGLEAELRRMAAEAQQQPDTETQAVSCSAVALRVHHAPHDWEPQPGMEPIPCPGYPAPSKEA